MNPPKSQCTFLIDNGMVMAKLLNFRNETGSFIQDKKFDGIPIFSAKSINIFTNSLQNGNSIKNSLELIGYSRHFNPDNINKIYLQLEQKNLPSKEQLIIFLFDCLSFLIFGPEKNKEDIIKKIYTIFNQNVKSDLSRYFCDIFTELTLRELKQIHNFDLNLLQLIIQQIAMNPSFDSSIPILLNSILKQCVYTKDIEMIDPVLSLIILLFEEKGINFNSKQCSNLISMLFEYINKMNSNSLIILAYSSQKYPKNEIIQESYRTLPNLIFNSYIENKSITFNPKEILIEKEIDDEPISRKEEMFNSPPENLIYANRTILDISSQTMQTLSNTLIYFISLSSSECISIFIEYLYEFRYIFYDSDYQIDLLIIILLLLETLSTKSSIDQCISLFIESSLFSPKYTIFNKGGLNPILNIIRDSTFNFISKINANLFIIFIENTINFPFLLAEYIMRLSYKYGNSFYNNSSIIFSLFCGLNNLQQEKNTRSKISAYTIILTAVFSLLDDPDAATICFSDESICPSFLNLLFQQDTSEIAINAFTKSIAKFTYLPEATINLLSTVFKMCATKSSDLQFKNIANHLIKSLILAMSHSISIGKSIAPIFDSTLNFLTSQNSPNNETLEMTLMICSLITQSQKSIEVNSERNKMILDILKAVEGDEPSNSTLMSLINQMNASTNITPGQMFIIQTPAVIPIILASFSRSKRLNSIVNLFYDLASFSVRNIAMCHEGDLCYILLQALKGEFEYNGRLLNFVIDENTSNDIFKLVIFVTSIRSSVKINNVFVTLILPDKKTGEMNKYSEKAASSLHRVFSSFDKSDYQIFCECPIFCKKDYDGTRLNNSFSFCFYATIDTNYMLQFPEGRFVFFKASDSQNHVLKVYLKNDLLFAEYEGEIAKWHASIQSKKQTFISVFFMTDDDEESTICYFKIGKEMSDDIPFRNLQFDKETTIEIGLTEFVSISSDDISPVSFDKFALILPPYDDGMFNKLESNRFNDLYSTFQEVSLFSDSMKINEKYHRIELSLPKLLPSHLNVHCFDIIFRNCDKLPLLFTETALEIVFLMLRYHNKKKFYPSLFLLQTDKIEKNDFPLFEFTKNFYDKRYCELRINDITYILSHFVNSKCSSNPIIFAIFLKAIESSSNKSFQLEMLENFVFNFFFWYSENVQNTKKNLRHLINFLSDFSIPEFKTRIFSEVLIQTYFLDCDFTKLYKLLPCNEKDIELIFALILYLNKKLCEMNGIEEKIEIQIFNYFEILIYFWTNRKKDKIHYDVLIYFVENVSKCPSEKIITELITFINALNYQNDKLVVELLILSALNSKFIFPSEYPNIACINAIKTGDISKLTKINEPFYNWQFWLTFTAVLLSSQILIKKIISFLKQPNYIDNYCVILSYFEILRSTKQFQNIQSLRDFFILSTLDSIISLEAQIIIQISLYSFYSIFHKLRKNSYSKCILNLFDEMNEIGSNLSSSQKVKKEIFLNIKDLDFDKMLSIFMNLNKNNSKMRFWASHNRTIDHNLLLKIKKSLSLPKNNIENLPIASMINIFISSYLRYNKIIVNSNSNSLFTYLDSSENVIRINFENKLNFCCHEISDFLQIKKSHFDYLDLIESNILIEKLRKQKINEIYKNNYNFEVHPIYKTSIENEKILDCSYKVSTSRFVKFPFPENSIKIKVSASLRNLKILGFRTSQIDRVQENHCFYCHLITFSKPIEATLHILKNQFLLFYLTNRIQISFNQVKLVSIVRQNCIEIFAEGCSSYLISLSQDDFHILQGISYFPFNLISNKDKAKKKIVNKFEKNKMTVFNLILSLNFISGRSFNDVGYFPVFPIVADKSLDFSIVSNREYPIVVDRWFDYIYGKEKKKINVMRNKEIEIKMYHIEEQGENKTSKGENKVSIDETQSSKDKASDDDAVIKDLNSETNEENISCTTNKKGTENDNDDDIDDTTIQTASSKNDNSSENKAKEASTNIIDEENDEVSKSDTNHLKKRMTWSDFLQDARNTQNCFSPLFFTTYDHFIDSFSDKTASEMSDIVYMMKKRIENSSKVLSWAKAFFNVQLENNSLNKKRQLETIKINLPHEVICSSFFENSEEVFTVLFSNGKVELMFILENTTKSLKKFLETFQINGQNMHLISLHHFIILYDSQKYVFYRISINNFNFIDCISYQTCASQILTVSDQLIFVIDKHQIVSFECEKFPKEGKVLFVEKSDIEIITSSSYFDVIIFSTSDGFLKVISSKFNEPSKSLLTEIKLDQKCQNILITKENGFIVVKTKGEIFTFSLNGRKLGNAIYKFSFIKAITALSPQKVDFVFFIDEKNQLNAFEAYMPKNILLIATDLPKISSMVLNTDKNILYLITYDGNILAHPVCF